MRSNDWVDALSDHAARLVDRRISDLITEDRDRFADSSLRVGPLFATFARQRWDRGAGKCLYGIARKVGVPEALRRLVDGAEVNRTERRPALHTALRPGVGSGEVVAAARAQVLEATDRMQALATALAEGPVTDVVNVGIGGSDLGPRFVVDALRERADGRFRVHFLSNVDAHAAQHLLRGLDPARSAAILVSKSFGTQETLLNGALLRAWLGDDRRLYAVSANTAKAAAFGVDAGQVLPMWDWVGGRYSLWSAVGFAARLALGAEPFAALLAGAAAMDTHALDTPLEHNLPVRHALAAIWNRNGLGLSSHAILPYDDRLARLPAYLQQLVMESLGKSVRNDGRAVEVATVPVLWGGAGTDSQHSFFQALHQGTDTVPADFIGVLRPEHPHAELHATLLANLLAQTEALANGATHADPHRRYPGNRPSTLILLDELSPQALGALIALYEHSVYVQSVLWDIDAFDQWGVELGKQIAGGLLSAVTTGDDSAVTDPITRALLAEIRTRRA